ncbi:MAG: glycosyltransferase [Rhodobacteraceae bacterium]|nr:glycosyltransferase [Paracoccaceae bacterium]
MKPKFTAENVTVVTVSYNSSPVLPSMLASLPEGVKVTIVNNGGRDTEALNRLPYAGEITIVENKKNQGFGQACNQGVRTASTDFVFLLNPDTEVQSGAVEALLQAAERHGPNAAFNPRITTADGTANFKRRSVLLPRNEWLPRGWPSAECEVPVLAGSAIFGDRNLFLRYQFDPRIFMYHEDDDWSLRVREAGGKLFFIPNAIVKHLGGHSSGRSSDIVRFKAFHLGKSRIFALKKHKRPFPRTRSVALALLNLLSPENFFSAKRRAKNFGFFEGVRQPRKHYDHPYEMPAWMSGVPLWKLKRELARLVRQFLSVPRALYDMYFITPVYDLVHKRKIVQNEGQIPATDRVAIYLIFPKRGLLESHKRSLDYIREAGYAPLVVSNLPLESGDLEYLKENSFRVIERPNVGYDFGGYRDGFFSVLPQIEKLERLVFLNDSSWFPVPGTKNWLLEAEKLDVDYAGAATSFGIRRVPRDRYQSIQWEYDTSLSEFHYCSYALSLGPRILRDQKYHNFWKRYALTAKKNKVVRFGEMGMSRFAIDNGFTHGATYDIASLPEKLSECSDEELNHYAKNMVFLGEWIMKEVLDSTLPLLDASRSPADREEVIRLLMATAARFGISYVLPEFLWDKHKFPFLKKSPVSIYQGDSDKMFNLIKKIGGPDGEIIEGEMAEIRSSRGFVEN